MRASSSHAENPAASHVPRRVNSGSSFQHGAPTRRLISDRLHGIILGMRFGLPFIGVDSDGKIEHLATCIRDLAEVIKILQKDR